MFIIYNIGIYFYQFIIRWVSIFNPKAKLWIVGRKNWRHKLEEATKGSENIIWFHAASLGEFEQGRPLIEKIKAEQKEVFILLTFFSPSGYEIQKDYKYADYVCYLPADTLNNAKDFISIVSPQKVFFIKYEFWFNYMRELKRQQNSLYLVSGVFRESQIFFKPYGNWFAKQLQAFTYFYVQDEISVENLKSLGYNNVLLAGDTRFDRVIEIAEQSKDIKLVKDFIGEYPCLVIGSSWSKDEDLLVEYINTHPNYRYVLAPHEIKESHLSEIESKISVPTQRWSNSQKGAKKEAVVLLVDNIGMLSSIYKYANLAYVGGAFSAGLHNILEAAVFGIPVIFGPKYSKFPEAKDLIDVQAAFSVSDYDKLSQTLDLLFLDKSKNSEAGEKSKLFIYKSKGSVEVVAKHIFT